MGVDVYSGDGDIDWGKVKEAGHSFAFIKCSEGQEHKDEKFEHNWKSAKEAGLIVGAYHFMRVKEDAGVQAQSLIERLRAVGYDARVDLPPALDLEDEEGTTEIGVEEMRKKVSKFLKTVEVVTRRLCFIYVSYSFGQDLLGPGYEGHPLWAASFNPEPKIPSYWKSYTIWQYSEAGTVDGIPNNGETDLNHWAYHLGSVSDWIKELDK